MSRMRRSEPRGQTSVTTTDEGPVIPRRPGQRMLGKLLRVPVELLTPQAARLMELTAEDIQSWMEQRRPVESPGLRNPLQWPGKGPVCRVWAPNGLAP